MERSAEAEEKPPTNGASGNEPHPDFGMAVQEGLTIVYIRSRGAVSLGSRCIEPRNSHFWRNSSVLPLDQVV